MKQRKPARPATPVRVLHTTDLARVTGGDGISKLEQHVDNPGQTAMKD